MRTVSTCLFLKQIFSEKNILIPTGLCWCVVVCSIVWLVYILAFWGRFLPGSPGWLWTYSVTKASFESWWAFWFKLHYIAIGIMGSISEYHSWLLSLFVILLLFLGFIFFNADFYISVNTNYYFQGSLYHLGSFEGRHCPILFHLLLSDNPSPSAPLCEVL